MLQFFKKLPQVHNMLNLLSLPFTKQMFKIN